MTYEDTLIDLNKKLAEYRAKGDIDSFNATQVMKEAVIAEMGAEAEEEYFFPS
tara:strand:- start:160 stop:318 length:159 start_codon:yes stop_codon:yes gene_type:complete